MTRGGVGGEGKNNKFNRSFIYGAEGQGLGVTVEFLLDLILYNVPGEISNKFKTLIIYAAEGKGVEGKC